MTALRFPDYFPPTTRWKKFFIGVRWLGPDMSFFESLKDTQALRDEKELTAWGGGRRQEVAAAVSEVLAEQLGWKSKVFLPEDSAVVAFHGPSFDWTDPERAFDAVVEMLAERFNVSPSKEFWRTQGGGTFGVLIDSLIENSDA